MTIRSVPVPAFFLVAVLPLCGQDAGSFPPSRPYRAQLAERGPVQEIGLREALALALMHNLDIELQSYGRDLSRASILNARSYIDTQAALNTSVTSINLPVTNILQTGESDSQITKTWSVAPSLQQNIPGGGTATLSMNLNRLSTNGLYVFINPVFSSTLGLTITQPLWRGFLRTAAERQIVVAQLNERITESQFRQKVEYVAEQTIYAYWRLVVVVEYYEAQRQARDVAVLDYEETQKRQQERHETALELTTKRSEVASSEVTMTQAAIQIAQASNNLKRLLAPSVFDPLWNVGLIAADRPNSGPDPKDPSISLEEATRTALERRPELEQIRLQIRQSEADVRFAKQETKPAVNLRLEMQSTGDAGRVYALTPEGTVSQVPDPTNPAYGAVGISSAQAFRIQHPSIAAGLEIKLPLRNRAANSLLATAVTGNRKLQSQLRAAQEDILVEVRNAWETIAAQRRNVEAANIARRLAEEQLASEMEKNGRDPQNLEVRRSERDLAEARVHELQALIDSDLSKVSFEKVIDTLLDERQIVLAHRE